MIQQSFNCCICKDEEWIITRIEDDSKIGYSDVAQQCECAKKKRINRLLESSKITEEFQKKTFKNFEKDDVQPAVSQAYTIAYKYVIDFKTIKSTRQNSIALLGNAGFGKTHLLMAISNNLIQRGVQVVYFPWVEGFNDLKDDFDKTNAKVTQLQQAEVLYIDDMFKGRAEPTPFQKEQLFAIINSRYLENKPILVSSERTIAEMCDFDEATGSRINEMCRDYKVSLKGGKELNYRLKGCDD